MGMHRREQAKERADRQAGKKESNEAPERNPRQKKQGNHSKSEKEQKLTGLIHLRFVGHLL